MPEHGIIIKCGLSGPMTYHYGLTQIDSTQKVIDIYIHKYVVHEQVIVVDHRDRRLQTRCSGVARTAYVHPDNSIGCHASIAQ